MSFFENSRDVSIYGANFIGNTTSKKGIDLLREHMAPGAFHNSAERYDPPKCHPETRIAVIQAIIDWIEDGQKTSFINWLNGPAGAGKSAIAQEIAELCHRSGQLAASFFWSRSAAGRNNEERLIASLAYQLLIAIPKIRSYVEEAVETDPSIFTRSLAAQMEYLVVEPLGKVFGNDQNWPAGSGTPKLIILDGLDECGTPEAQRYVLKVISHSIQKFSIPLFFLIASRPEQAIRDSFDNQPLLDITARLTLDEKYRPDDDIRLFLVESFGSVKRTHAVRSLLPCVWPTNKDIDVLVRKSSGQFIYAATIVKFIRSPHHRPDEQLNIVLGITASENATPFAELDALYHTIFNLSTDLPKVLEVLSCLFLVNLVHSIQTKMDLIEAILSYAPGTLRLILIDLHSIIHVPAIETREDQIHVLHASLQDFIMDPARAGRLYIDRGKAHAGIARHFLKCIEDYSRDRNYLDGRDEVVFSGLTYHCTHSSPTRELLTDFFNFNFEKWVYGMSRTTYFTKRDYAMPHYYPVLNLYAWMQSQETNVQEYFGPERSLRAHHSSSFEAAVSFIYGEISHCLLEQYPTNGKNAYTATTHPRMIHLCSLYPSAFERVIGVPFRFDVFLYQDNQLDEFRKYLRDPERTGTYFVHGGMYATLSVCIFKFIFDTEAPKHIQEEDGGEKEQHDLRESSLKFAIATLPFYLSNADYTPELARHADRLLSHEVGLKEDGLRSETKLLHEAIDLYLKKRPPTSIAPQEQFPASTPENQLINPAPGESINTFKALFERRFREEKLHPRNSDGDRN